MSRKRKSDVLEAKAESKFDADGDMKMGGSIVDNSMLNDSRPKKRRKPSAKGGVVVKAAVGAAKKSRPSKMLKPALKAKALKKKPGQGGVRNLMDQTDAHLGRFGGRITEKAKGMAARKLNADVAAVQKLDTRAQKVFKQGFVDGRIFCMTNLGDNRQRAKLAWSGRTKKVTERSKFMSSKMKELIRGGASSGMALKLANVAWRGRGGGAKPKKASKKPKSSKKSKASKKK